MTRISPPVSVPLNAVPRSSSSRQHVLVLGGCENARRIAFKLSDAGVTTFRVNTVQQCSHMLGVATCAVVVVSPLEGVSVSQFAASHTREHSEIPVFLSLPRAPSNQARQELYSAGVQAVFQWPADRRALLNTMCRLANAEMREGTSPARDVALEEKVNARLDQEPELAGGQLVSRVKKRLAILFGSVDAPWKLRRAEHVARETLGVDDAANGGVEVEVPAVSDSQLASDVRLVIEKHPDVDASTLAVSSDDATISVAGSFRDRQEAGAALEAIRRVAGVRSVESYATIAPRAKQRDRSLVGRLRKALQRRREARRAHVSAFDGVAVVTGRVRHGRDKARLIALVRRQPGVKRVIDKLETTSNQEKLNHGIHDRSKA